MALARITKLGTLGVSLLAGCGAGADDPATTDTAAFVRIGGVEPYRILGLGVDDSTYTELGMPSDVENLGPSASGMRELRIHLDAYAPAPVYEFLLSSWQAPTAQQTWNATSFSVLLGGGGAQPVGLLLPAIQKFNGASIEQDGTLMISVAGGGSVGLIDDVTLDPDATKGGVNVAAGDVNGYVSSSSGQQMIAAVRSPARFDGTGAGLVSQPIELGRPASGLPSWFDFAQPVSLAVDVRQPGGAVLHRFRLASAKPEPDDGLSIRLPPLKAIYVIIPTIDGESIAEEPIDAMMATSYKSFSDRSYLAAISQVETFTSLDPSGGAPALADAKTYWAANRDSAIVNLHAAVAHAADHEGMLCQVALPATLAVAKGIAQQPLSGDAATAVATTIEALRASSQPVPGAFAGGALAMSAMVGASVAGDAAPACRALAEVAPFGDGLAASGAVDPSKAGSLNLAMAIAASPRALDRAMFEWIELLDAIVAGTIVDTDTALAAAKAKADILIESLGAHAQASESRFDVAHQLIAL